jgi:uncharacterized alkaline shock family protein YloU
LEGCAICDEDGKGVREEGWQRYDSPLVSDRGRTAISDTVVTTIAGRAAQEVDGVHMGSVSVDVGAVEAAIDLTMGIEYGRNIRQTVKEVRHRISDRVQSMIGLRVTKLKATVTDITLTEEGGGRRTLEAGTRTETPDAVEREPAEDRPVPHSPRYEQSIIAVTLFFAALLGFGLNHILETEHTARGSVIADHRWGFFWWLYSSS